MICKLSGKIESLFGEMVEVCTPGGVSYSVTVTKSLYSTLNMNEECEIITELVVREDAWSLYGFSNNNEKKLFKLLTTVQGVGAKSAINLLSELGESGVQNAIVSGDVTTLCSANGVGPKIAKRIANELKGKVAGVSTELVNTRNNTLLDTVSALTNLGFKRADAIQVTEAVMAEYEDKSNVTFEELIRECLKRIK